MKTQFPRRFKQYNWLIVCVVACLIGCDHKGATSQSQIEDLEYYQGSIDHSDSTYDAAKSRLYVRASKLLQNGELEDAKTLYQQAIATYPHDPEGHAALGACFYFEHKFDEAKSHYLLALKIDDGCLSAHYGLGCVAYEQHFFKDAVAHLSRAIEIDENDSDSHRVLGLVLHEIGNTKQASYHDKQATALDKDDRESGDFSASPSELSEPK